MIEILYEIFYVSKLITEFKGYYEAFLLVLQSNDLNCTLNLKLRKMEKACTHFWQINSQIFGRTIGRIFGRFWPNIRYWPIPVFALSVVHYQNTIWQTWNSISFAKFLIIMDNMVISYFFSVPSPFYAYLWCVSGQVVKRVCSNPEALSGHERYNWKKWE